MKIKQYIYSNNQWQAPFEPLEDAQLILMFGDRKQAVDPGIIDEIKTHYPKASIIGCSTSGEIAGSMVYDDSLCMTVIELEHSHLAIQKTPVTDESLESVIYNLASQLDQDNLRYVLVLSDGQKVNGTELVEGLSKALGDDVLITGGLAGDGTRFAETQLWHDGVAEKEQIILCAFYGDALQVAHGSMGGWDSFGPERLITQSKDNVLYSLDNQPALELYKKYLGEYSKDLPSSALLFPLLIKRKGGQREVIRTILNINDEDGSMIFAGDIPEGATAQLMRANFDRLIDGAGRAAENTLEMISAQPSSGLVLMISCVGRRLVLKQRVEEELEAVNELFGPQWTSTGFYSYGEISPVSAENYCDLHNQTMTITAIFEQHE